METKFLFSRNRVRALFALCGAFASLVFIAGFGANQANAGLPLVSLLPNTSGCTYPQLTQPFASAGDANWYTLAAGQTVDNFDGTNWQLSGGAKIVKSTKLASGRTGSVLDLPSGATATSPPMCVDKTFQTARMMVKSLKGTDGLQAYATYDGLKLANIPLSIPRNSGGVKGLNDWSISDPISVRPSNNSRWQVVRFTILSKGVASESQVYNFYVDPRMK
jgi:hypothetical protein